MASPVEQKSVFWRGGRVLASVILILFAVTSARFSLAYAYRQAAPEKVLRLVSSEPLASLALLDREVQAQRVAVSDTRLRTTALTALTAQPLDATALRLLALSAEGRGEDDRALRLLQLAERVTRRDLLVQLALVEHAVAGDNVTEALVHYDRALRTRPRSSDILFPILTSAIAEPAIRAGLVEYVRRRTPWIINYLEVAMDSPGGAASVAALLLADVGPRGDIFEQLSEPLLTKLLNQGLFPLARQFFLTMPNANERMLADAGISQATTDHRYGAFSWQRLDTPGASVAFDRNGKGASILASWEPASRGAIMWRVVALPAGRYRLGVTQQILGRNSGAEAKWRMSCVQGGGRRLLWESSSDLESTVRQQGPVIPPGCDWQILELTGAGGDGQQPFELEIVDLDLSKA